MRRKAIVLLTVTWVMLGIVTTPKSSAWAAPEAATLESVTLSATPTGTELVLRVNGIYSYKTVQASPDTLFIDLAGANIKRAVRSQQWVNPVFSGYKLLAFQDASGQPVVRVQVDTKQVQPFVVQKDSSGLRLLCGNSLPSSAEVAPTPAAVPEAPSARLGPPASPRGNLVVSKVTFDKQESGETFVDVATSRTVSYQVMMLSSPARLVVDIEGARNTSPQKSYTVDTVVLKGVRIGQFRAKDPSVVRVVADLKGNPAFDVHSTPSGLRIELRPRGMMNSAPLANQLLNPAAKPEGSKTLAITAVTSAHIAVSKVAVPAPTTEVIERKPAAAPPVQAENQEAVKPEVQSTLPALAGSKQVTSAPIEVNKVAVLAPTTEVIDRKPAVAPPVQVENREAVKPEVQSTLPALVNSKQAMAAPLPPPSSATPEALRANHAALALNPVRDEAGQGVLPGNPTGPSAEARPAYTGEPISLNLKDVDLKDFFRLIHEISGLNIILDPNVSGSVTLVLDSVPWDQALDIVLKNNRLGKVLEGNVLRIAKVETLTAEQEGQTKLAAARMDAAPLVTVFRPINYAKATDIAALLKTWAGGGALSRRGTVLVDTRGNTLIISDVQSQIPIIENVVSKIDKKAKQISIEARVVLATADFTRTLSSSLLGGFQNRSTVATGTTGANSSITIPTPTASQPFPITTATSATSSGFGVASVVNVGANYFINAAISAAEERDQAKTISRPSIVTQNNVQGMVMQGVQVPIQTSINNTIAVQYENATLQLTVTPQVTDDNNIFLIIMVNNASVGAVVSGAGPSINTQQATTEVLVPDGGTVVFGGITVTSRSKSATYIPLLGNIPVLGHLFKTSNTSDQDQELLFFVTPKILPG
jgi:type IV pilus assembly protein PilQ